MEITYQQGSDELYFVFTYSAISCESRDTLAIDDDQAAIIIAVFYSRDLGVTSLAAAGVGIAVLFILKRMAVRSRAAYLITVHSSGFLFSSPVFMQRPPVSHLQGWR